MKPTLKDDVAQLAELLRTFDALKRQRAAFLRTFGGDEIDGGEYRSYSSRILTTASGHSHRFLLFRATSGYPPTPTVEAEVPDWRPLGHSAIAPVATTVPSG